MRASLLERSCGWEWSWGCAASVPVSSSQSSSVAGSDGSVPGETFIGRVRVDTDFNP